MNTIALPFGLNIGGIAFYCDGALPPLEQRNSSVYEAFITSDPPPEASCYVSMSVIDGLNIPERDPAFDASPTWSAYGDRDTGWDILRHTGKGSMAAWNARCTGDLSRAHIYLNSYIPASSGRPAANPLSYPLDQLLLNQMLASHGGILLHAASAIIGDQAVLFPGVSGAGKSTLAKLIADQPCVTMLSDDRTLLRPDPDGIHAYGTPWPGEGGFAENRSAPLARILFLEQASETSIVPLEAAASSECLLTVASIPWYDTEARDQALSFIDTLCQTVETGALRFTRDQSSLFGARTLIFASTDFPEMLLPAFNRQRPSRPDKEVIRQSIHVAQNKRIDRL